MAQLFRSLGIVFALAIILLEGSFCEEGIVEVDDSAFRTVVRLQWADIHYLGGMGEFRVDGI